MEVGNDWARQSVQERAWAWSWAPRRGWKQTDRKPSFGEKRTAKETLILD